MHVVVAGANGAIGRHLLTELVDAGHTPIALIRDEGQAAELRELGAEPRLADLSDDGVGDVVEGADAVIFSAGAGPGSGAGPKVTVDLEGAVKLIEGCERHGVDRYVMVSTMGADDPSEGPESMQAYLVAKAGADARLRRSELQWTIVRPGSLTDDDPAGTVDAAAPSLGRRGEISRADVAAVLAAVLAEPQTAGVSFEVLAGDTPAAEAVAALASA
ncbi:MAG: SDR family oxidoreductase [Solirubrobacterales bacterium]